MILKNHKIKIEVLNVFTEETIGRRETSDLEIAEQILADVPQWVDNAQGMPMCSICDSINELKEVEGKNYCEDCIEKIINGDLKIDI